MWVVAVIAGLVAAAVVAVAAVAAVAVAIAVVIAVVGGGNRGADNHKMCCLTAVLMVRWLSKTNQ